MNAEQLENYITNFRPELREKVYKEFLDGEILRKAFETTEGKAILNNCIDLITSNTVQIIRYCSEHPPSESVTKIYPYASEIHTVYKLMEDWAKTLLRASEHTKQIEKKG